MTTKDYFAIALEAKRALDQSRYEAKRKTKAFKAILSINSGDSRLVAYSSPKPERVALAAEEAERREERIARRVEREVAEARRIERRWITESRRRR